MDSKPANLNDDRFLHRTPMDASPLAEFVANIHVWQPARIAASKKLKKKDKRPDSANQLTAPTAGDENARRLRERSSWLSIPRGSSSSISQGQWIPARCCLNEFEGSRCELAVYDEQDPCLLYSVSIHPLLHTEIRQAHKSLFFCPNVITIHPKHGKAFGQLAGGEQYLAGNTSSGVPPALPTIATNTSSSSQHHLPNSSSPGASSGAPPSAPSPALHIRFPTVDLYNTWLLLLRTFSQPETYGTKLLSEPERSSVGGLYRMWRGIEMEVIEGRNLLNSIGSGVSGWSDRDILASVLSPQSGPAAGDTRDPLSPPGSSSGSLLNPSGPGLPPPLSGHSLTSSPFSSTSANSDHDIFCEVYVDSVLFGRTTSKRVSPTSSSGDGSMSTGKTSLRPQGSSLGSVKESSVIWHESMRFPDVAPHGTLALNIYKVRPSSHSQPSPSSTMLPSSIMGMAHPPSVPSSAQHLNQQSQHQHPAHHLGKSISGGVAMIGQAAVGGVSKLHGHKEREREPVSIGTVEIALTNFRRGEWVEGWWSIIPAHGTEGRTGVAEVKLKVKVDEEIVLPSKAYGSLSSIITSQNPLDLISAASGRPTTGETIQRTQGGRARTAPPTLDSESPRPLQGSPLVFDHTHHTHIAHHLHIIGAHNNTLVPSILPMLQAEVIAIAASPQGSNTLFRGNTVLTKTIEFAMHFYGKQWLESSVGPVVRRFCNERVSIEVDISKLKAGGGKKHLMRDGVADKGSAGRASGITAGNASGDAILGVAKELDANVKSLVKWCTEFWDSIWNARAECPNELRIIFQHIRTLVDARWGNMTAFSNRSSSSVSSTSVGSTDSSEDDRQSNRRERRRDFHNLRFQSISAFVFLRMIVPAILTPHLFGLVDGFPPTYVQRSLRSIAKVMQSLANLNMTVHQEEHMRPVKDFLLNQYDGMIDYLLNVSNLAPEPLPPKLSSSPSLSTGLRDTRDGNRSFHSLERNYSADRSFTSTTYSISNSEYSSPPSYRSNLGPGFDHQATLRYLHQRSTRLSVLHRESIPTLPHLIDVSKHLAILSSTIVRNAKGSRKTVGYSAHVLASASKGAATNMTANGQDPAPQTEANGTRAVLGAEARPEDFQMVCFDIHAEALGCVTKLMPSRTRKKSYTSERQRPSTVDQLQQYPSTRQRSISQPRAMSANAETRPTFIDPRAGMVPPKLPSPSHPTPSPSLPQGSRGYGESRGYPGGKISISTIAANSHKPPPIRSTSGYVPSSPSHPSPSTASYSSRYPATDSPTASTTVFSPVSPGSPVTAASRRGAATSSDNSSGGETHMSMERTIEMGSTLPGMSSGTLLSTTRRQRTIRPATAPSSTITGPSSESGTSTESLSKRRNQDMHPPPTSLRIPINRALPTAGGRDRDLPTLPHNPNIAQIPHGIPEPNIIPASMPTTPIDSTGSHYYRQPGSGSHTPHEQRTPSGSSDERKYADLQPPNVLGRSGLSRPASNPTMAHAYTSAADTSEDATNKKRKGFFRGLLSSKNR